MGQRETSSTRDGSRELMCLVEQLRIWAALTQTHDREDRKRGGAEGQEEGANSRGAVWKMNAAGKSTGSHMGR